MGGVGHTGRVEYTRGVGHLGGVGQLGFEARVQRQWLFVQLVCVCSR